MLYINTLVTRLQSAFRGFRDNYTRRCTLIFKAIRSEVWVKLKEALKKKKSFPLLNVRLVSKCRHTRAATRGCALTTEPVDSQCCQPFTHKPKEYLCCRWNQSVELLYMPRNVITDLLHAYVCVYNSQVTTVQVGASDFLAGFLCALINSDLFTLIIVCWNVPLRNEEHCKVQTDIMNCYSLFVIFNYWRYLAFQLHHRDRTRALSPASAFIYSALSSSQQVNNFAYSTQPQIKHICFLTFRAGSLKSVPWTFASVCILSLACFCAPGPAPVCVFPCSLYLFRCYLCSLCLWFPPLWLSWKLFSVSSTDLIVTQVQWWALFLTPVGPMYHFKWCATHVLTVKIHLQEVESWLLQLNSFFTPMVSFI